MSDHTADTCRVLWVTNDLPPRHGGIESFIGALLERTFTGTTHVLGPAADSTATTYDQQQSYSVHRLAGRVLPTRATLRAIIDHANRHHADVIVLGALWPLGHLAGRLKRALHIPVVALSHGHEAGLVTVGAGPLIRHATRRLDLLTTISRFTEVRLGRHNHAARTIRIPPGVDIHRFTPKASPRPASLTSLPHDALVVGAVSRLVRRKGFDRLIDAWETVRAAHPHAWLVIAGDGPDRQRLHARVKKQQARQVLFVGAPAHDDLPALYQAFDVFVQPVRTRNLGLDVEGLGIVFLEAQATGLPLVAGRSGGAPETVKSATYGTTVDGRDVNAIARAVITWLDDDTARDTARIDARHAAETHWSWETIATTFHTAVTAVVARQRVDKERP